MQNSKISVLGVGRDGCDFVTKIIDSKTSIEPEHIGDITVIRHAEDFYSDINFATLCFDEEDLLYSFAPLKIYLENLDDFSKVIRENFLETDIIFIVSSEESMFMASRVSCVLRTSGVFSVGIFCFSWHFVHSNNFIKSINEYEKSFDLWFHGLNIGADEFQSIFEFLTDFTCKSGFVNLDFDDIKNFLKDSGYASYCTGYFGGLNKVSNAAFQAISAFYRRERIVTKILVNIMSSTDIKLEELTDAVQVIKEKAGNPDVEIMWAHILDEKLNNSARVSLIAIFKKD